MVAEGGPDVTINLLRIEPESGRVSIFNEVRFKNTPLVFSDES